MSDKQGQQLGLTHPFKTSRKRISVTFLTQFSALTTLSRYAAFVSFNKFNSYKQFSAYTIPRQIYKSYSENLVNIFDINS